MQVRKLSFSRLYRSAKCPAGMESTKFGRRRQALMAANSIGDSV
jgi:hypothetical protein